MSVEIGEPVDSVTLRPHPTEADDKYAWALENRNLNVVIAGKRGLLEEISDSDWVVGRSSMALVVAIIAGKKAFSCIPPGGKACSLPHKEIQHLGL